jgi:tripartite-type tricarboxylate transporter receptor subunit TctC
MPLPGYSVESWYGILGPAKIPRSIVDAMNREMNRIVQDPAFVTKDLKPAGIAPAPTTPELFKQRLEAEVRKYVKLARDAQITPQ